MSANDRQEGGVHYQTGHKQHWDLVIDYNWDYFQSQITKYLMRWKTKHSTPEKRLEDLKKARHFLDKYIENFDSYDAKPDNKAVSGVNPEATKLFDQFIDAAKTVLRPFSLEQFEVESPRYVSDNHFLCEGGSGSGVNLYTCRRCKQQLWALNLKDMHAIHTCVLNPDPAAEPTGAYVNQGDKNG